MIDLFIGKLPLLGGRMRKDSIINALALPSLPFTLHDKYRPIIDTFKNNLGITAGKNYPIEYDEPLFDDDHYV
jgi:hypothetical protein